MTRGNHKLHLSYFELFEHYGQTLSLETFWNICPGSILQNISDTQLGPLSNADSDWFQTQTPTYIHFLTNKYKSYKKRILLLATFDLQVPPADLVNLCPRQEFRWWISGGIWWQKSRRPWGCQTRMPCRRWRRMLYCNLELHRKSSLQFIAQYFYIIQQFNSRNLNNENGALRYWK